MIQLLGISDYEEIEKMTLHKEIYPYVSSSIIWNEDIANATKILLASGIWKFIGINKPIQGLVVFTPLSDIMWQMHIQIYPEFRKKLDDDIHV
jgi:hypothetical protein